MVRTSAATPSRARGPWSAARRARAMGRNSAGFRITSINMPGLLELSYSLDDADNITALADDMNAGRNQAFSYDAVDRLTDAAGGYGTFQFTFDPVGNRLTEDDDGLLTNTTTAPTTTAC